MTLHRSCLMAASPMQRCAGMPRPSVQPLLAAALPRTWTPAPGSSPPAWQAGPAPPPVSHQAQGPTRRCCAAPRPRSGRL
eukprot:11090404-Alexandrium_andersonii.AAC.1